MMLIATTTDTGTAIIGGSSTITSGTTNMIEIMTGITNIRIDARIRG
jgi:hypothetical protein